MSESSGLALAGPALVRFIACALGYSLAALLARYAGGFDLQNAGAEQTLLMHGAGCAGFLLMALRLPPSAPLWPPRRVLLGVGAYLAFLLAWVPFAIFAYPTVAGWLHLDLEPQPHLLWLLEADPARWQYWAFLLTVVAGSPLMEEVMFRGFARDLLRGLLGPAAGIVLTSVLFGLAHGVALALPLALLGLLFGWLRERTGGLAAAAAAHALHNGLVVGVALAFPQLVDEVFR